MTKLKSLMTGTTAIMLLLGSPSWAAEQGGLRIANNDSIYINGSSLEIVPGKGKGDASALIKKLDAHAVGPGMIIFRSGDKLYIADVSPSVAQTSYASDRYGSDRDTSVSAAQAEREWQEFLRQNRRYGSDRDTSVSAAQAEREWQEFLRQNPRYGSDRDTSVSAAQADREWQEFLRQKARYGSDRDTSVSAAQADREWQEFLRQNRRYGSDRDTSVSAAQAEREWQEFLRNSRYGSDRVVINDPEYAQYKLKKIFDDNWTAGDSK
jgi:hypothetical protein